MVCNQIELNQSDTEQLSARAKAFFSLV